MSNSRTPFGRRLDELRERGIRRVLDRADETVVDRDPIGGGVLTGLDPTLRWGGSTPYEFIQQAGPIPPPPDPASLMFTSNLLAQARVERPRTWSVLMQVSFEAGSEWAGSAGTHVRVVCRLLIGAGQVNIPLEQYFTGNPAAGMTGQGQASPFPPFATLTAFWEAVPAAEIDAQVLIYTDQSGSPNIFSGQVACIIAPYYPLER